MGQRITINISDSGFPIVEGDPFATKSEKSLDEILGPGDTLLNFLKEEVKVGEDSDDFKIPDNAPIRLAEKVAEYYGGEVRDYLTLPQYELEQLYIEMKKNNPAEPITPNTEKSDNNELRKAFDEEQLEILKQKITNSLYNGTENIL